MGKRELVALLYLSSWCLVMVEWLFLAVSRGCLRFVIVVLPDHTHLIFFISSSRSVELSMEMFITWGPGGKYWRSMYTVYSDLLKLIRFHIRAGHHLEIL